LLSKFFSFETPLVDQTFGIAISHTIGNGDSFVMNNSTQKPCHLNHQHLSVPRSQSPTEGTGSEKKSGPISQA
jgi:hypothetical protein